MSPRCKKPRNCKCKFKGKAFKPTCIPMSEVEQIPLLREELEVLKLCDLDDLTQEEAGAKMGVSTRDHSKNPCYSTKKGCESAEQRPGYRISIIVV